MPSSLARIKSDYFYPRPPRGGRLREVCQGGISMSISIHALREEGDLTSPAPGLWRGYFYPRPPRGGRLDVFRIFLHSTQYFYPRPPRGGRPSHGTQSDPYEAISIHALREEGDIHGFALKLTIQISIHALREEGDKPYWLVINFQVNFYPRPPRGGRHSAHFLVRCSYLFLSTPSARRATP